MLTARAERLTPQAQAKHHLNRKHKEHFYVLPRAGDEDIVRGRGISSYDDSLRYITIYHRLRCWKKEGQHL
jgi:hypothetical protein